MITLGLDTALQSCSVAIIQDGEVLSDNFIALEKGHAEKLAPMAAAALDEARLSVSDLDRVGVVIGPGGFTGVRVGLSFARGLILGTGVKLAGISSLTALAEGVNGPEATHIIGAVIDARRGQVFAALYDAAGVERLPPFVADPKEAASKLAFAAQQSAVVLVGSGAELVKLHQKEWVISSASRQIDAKIVARLAAAADIPSTLPAPLYLRPADAKPAGRALFEGLSLV